MKDSNINEKFLELLDPLRDKLYMYARALEKSTEDAEDLVSDTILTCLENFSEIQDYSKFKSYIFKIVRNKFKRKSRKNIFWAKYDESRANEIPSNGIQTDLPTDIAFLYNALDQLPDKQKEALVLFEISGFSMSEIRDFQGGSISAIKSRIKRGREKLSELLTDSKDNKITQTSKIYTL